MGGIKAIETKYKGYRFRSRLEARWAVFFDALKLAWDYEPEGYELPTKKWMTDDPKDPGIEVVHRYLPDFYIRDCEMFVEIKGSTPTPDEFGKCSELAQQSGKAVLVCWGLPYENPNYLYCWDTTDSSGGSFDTWGSFLWPVSSATGLVVHAERLREDRRIYLGGNFTNEVYNLSCAPFDPNAGHFDWAVNAARAARFEHGEKP
jgi:hypothetical protein